jgi:type VII secretion ATPase EccA
VVSRFATCCRALGLSVHDRQRPADLTAARTGFAGLTRIAHEQCDAWTGLAAAGEVDNHVVEAIWRTSPSAGVLQQQIGLAPRALGFTYDTGLYLQFRATDPDDFQLAYAATLSDAAKYADADRLVGELLDRRSDWLQATWMRVAICHRAERWSDVVRLLTAVVTDPSLDEVFSHAVRVTLGNALARLGMFAPALSYLEEPDGPIAVAAVDGALDKALVLRAQGEDEDANDLLHELYAANPENANIEEALSDPTFGLGTTTAARIDARTNPWDPDSEPSEAEFVDPGA